MPPSLTPDQIRLVRTTWSEVSPLAYTLSGDFYQRLFALDPSAHALFVRTDMGEQRTKFIRMLSLIVRELSNPERLHPEMVALGERHAGYGVRAEQYEVMKTALLWTLERALGSAFTPAVRAAWAAAFAYWTALMREGDPGAAPLPDPEPST